MFTVDGQTPGARKKKKKKQPGAPGLVPLGVGVGAAGLGLTLAHRAMNPSFVALREVRQFADDVTAAPDATEALVRYVGRAHKPLNAPAYGGKPAVDFALKSRHHVPTMGSVEHYRGFASGPADALEQLAREGHFDNHIRSDTRAAVFAAHATAAAAAGGDRARYRAAFADALVPAAAPGQGNNTLWRDFRRALNKQPPGTGGLLNVPATAAGKARTTAGRLADVMYGADSTTDVNARLGPALSPQGVIDRSRVAASLDPLVGGEASVRLVMSDPAADVAALTQTRGMPVADAARAYRMGAEVAAVPGRLSAAGPYLLAGGAGLVGLGALLAWRRRRKRLEEAQSAKQAAAADSPAPDSPAPEPPAPGEAARRKRVRRLLSRLGGGAAWKPDKAPPPAPGAGDWLAHATKTGEARLDLAGVLGQLPRVRLPDTAAGSVLGAGAGLLAERLRKKDKAKRRYGRAALAGAAGGAALANLLGDRLRRYVSNTVMPVSYDDPGGQAAPTWKKVWRAGVLDEPEYDPDRVARHAARHPDSAAEQLAARRELFRRQLGVHTARPAEDVWAPNPDGSVSLNPANPAAGRYVEKLLTGPGAADRSTGKWMEDAARANSADEKELPPRLMAPVVGGQTVDYEPVSHFNDSSAPRTEGVFKVRDRWDVTLDPSEREFLAAGLGKALALNGSWFRAPHTGAEGRVAYTAGRNLTNRQVAKSLIAREILDKLLVHENPVVTQRLHIVQPKDGKAVVTPQTGAGVPYAKP